MATVADVLDGKGRGVYRIDGGATVLDAVQAMVEANVGALLVGDGVSIIGIVTERDYLRRVTLGRSCRRRSSSSRRTRRSRSAWR
jgi:CBS domain-containing protein